jgi:hypothetical protein
VNIQNGTVGKALVTLLVALATHLFTLERMLEQILWHQTPVQIFCAVELLFCDTPYNRVGIVIVHQPTVATRAARFAQRVFRARTPKTALVTRQTHALLFVRVMRGRTRGHAHRMRLVYFCFKVRTALAVIFRLYRIRFNKNSCPIRSVTIVSYI